MNVLEKAIKLFHAHKFNQSLQGFASLLAGDEADDHSREISFDYSIKALQILGETSKRLDISWKFVKFLVEKEMYEKSYKVIHSYSSSEIREILLKIGLADYYETFLKVCLKIGLIEKFKEGVVEYLEELLLKKNFVKGIDLINSVSKNDIKMNHLLKYLIAFYTLQKNEKEMSQKLQSFLSLSDQKMVLLAYDFLNKFNSDISKDIFLYQLCINAILSRSLQGHNNLIERKKLITMFYEYLLLFSQDFFIVKSLLLYGEKLGKKNILMALKKNIDSGKIIVKKSKKNNAFCERVFKEIPNLEDDSPVELKSFDLASDLFVENNKENIAEDEKLRDKFFLESIGQEVELEKKRDHNDVLDGEHEEVFSSLVGFKKEDFDLYKSKIENKINAILKKTTTEREGKEFSKLYLAQVKELVREEGHIAVKSILMTFHFYHFFHEGVDFVDFILSHFKDEFSELEVINIKFMKATFLKEMRSYYKAIDLLEDAISSEVLLKNEELAHLYLLADCYFYLDKFSNSLKIYKLINLKRPYYRQVIYRIKAIEAYK